MSQLTLKKSTAWLQRFHRSDGFLVFSFFFTALSFRSAVFLYPGLAFFYQRNRREGMAAAIGTLAGSCFSGFAGFYCQLLLLVFFLLLICLIQLLRQNLFAWFPMICGLNVLLASLATGTAFAQGLAAAGASVLICRFTQSDWMWIDTEFKLSMMMLGILGCSLIYPMMRIFPLEGAWMASVLVMACLAMTMPVREYLALCLGLLFCFPVGSHTPVWCAALLLMNILRQDLGWMRFLGWMVPLIWTQQPAWSLAAGIVIFLAAQQFPASQIAQRWVSEEKQTLNGQRIEGRKRTLLHQLSQFSHIFDLIADYFEPIQPSQSRILEGMADALDTVAMQMKQSVVDDEALSDKLVNLLEGYHFEVKRVHVQQWEEGPLQVVIDFSQLSHSELEEVVLPLIHMVIDPDLKVTRFQRNRIFYTGSRLELSTSQPSTLKTRLFTLKKDPEVSGDTSAVFRNGQTTICTISDGMGCGPQAARSSQFVTQVLQRMLSAKLPVEAAVQSINALLHADQRELFATLDFLCYDQRRHQAFLSKSGACPTYLIREDQIMEISGESLPIGIIQEIETDCFQIDCQDQDCFVMSSDGVEKQVLDQWVRGGDPDQVLQRIESGLKSIEETGCTDDVTVLVARVSKR